MSKFCTSCGSQIDDGAGFCPACGARQPEAAAWTPPEAPAQSAVYAPPMSEREFYTAYAGKSIRSTFTGTWIYCLVGAAVFTALGVIFGEEMGDLRYFFFMDAGVYAVLGVLLAVTRSRWVSGVLAAYGIVGLVLGILSDGTPAGALVAALGANVTSGLGRVRKAYKRYLATGELPAQPIK